MVSWNAPLQVYDYCRCWCLTMHVFLMWSVYRCSINYIFFKSFPSTLLLYGSSHLKGIHFISLTVFLWSNIKCGLHCMPSILIHAAISESYWIEFSSFSVNNTVLLWSLDFSKDSCSHPRFLISLLVAFIGRYIIFSFYCYGPTRVHPLLFQHSFIALRAFYFSFSFRSLSAIINLLHKSAPWKMPPFDL